MRRGRRVQGVCGAWTHDTSGAHDVRHRSSAVRFLPAPPYLEPHPDGTRFRISRYAMQSRSAPDDMLLVLRADPLVHG